MRALSERLAERETLVYSELREILGKPPFAAPEEHQPFLAAGSNPFTDDLGVVAAATAAATSAAVPPAEGGDSAMLAADRERREAFAAPARG